MAIKPKRQRTDRMEGGGGAGISRGLGGVRGASGRGAVKPSLKKPLAEPKSAVKVLPRKTAPKSGLEGRGAKLTPAQQRERAQKLRWDKQERNYERSMENQYQQSYTGKDNKFFTSKPGKANTKKAEAIKKESLKKVPKKINSAPKKGTKRGSTTLY